MVQVMSRLAFVGGTGPQGLGLAMRFAQAGETVLIGSRSASRADATASRIRAAVPGAVAEGVENLDAIARSERIVLTLPAAALPTFLETARTPLAGKLVIDVAVPVALRDGFFELAPVPGAPSAGELVQKAVPSARVVSAFKNVSAERLQDLSAALEGDVVLCGDDAAARTEVAALVAKLPGLRAVDAGRLANARYLEAITALLLNLNRRFRARTSIAIVGLG
ncbi:MAG: NADPH-dependent F420 reductase [Deltaproteobacteria bacterium]|nr:MAG: NADPH-dependent F420 reductase [Deltaproteobacteria bacterium]